MEAGGGKGMKGTPPRNSFSFSGCANGGKAGAPPPVQPRTLAQAGAQEIPTEPSEHRIRLGRGPCGRKPPLQRVEKKHSASSQVHRLRTTQPKHRLFTRRSDRQITLRYGPAAEPHRHCPPSSKYPEAFSRTRRRPLLS